MVLVLIPIIMSTCLSSVCLDYSVLGFRHGFRYLSSAQRYSDFRVPNTVDEYGQRLSWQCCSQKVVCYDYKFLGSTFTCH